MRTVLLSAAVLLVVAMTPAPAHAATCNDFSNQAAAQRAANTRDPDGDGIYCEDLPCPCSRAADGGGSRPRHHTPKPRRRSAPAKPRLGHSVLFRPRTKARRRRLRGALPDPACTPGAYYPRATRRLICRTGYTALVRDVTDSTKNAVYRQYGIRHHRPGQYEIDHLVPLELGGSNSIANLFPQRRRPRPGFRDKDRLENAANMAVCEGRIALRRTQLRIAADWTNVYASLIGTLPGTSATGGGAPFESAG